MNRPPESRRGRRFSLFAGQSERTILLGTVLVVSSISLAMAYILIQWFAVDVIASLLNVPQDCWVDWQMGIGRHCFSDYAMTANVGLQANPWTYELTLPWGNYQPHPIGYPAGGLLPAVLFGFPAHLLGAPQLGLLAYLLALSIAVFAPAVWAARGAHGLERVVVLVALGAAAIPAWGVIDRGNTAGFIVPVALVFLVALRRQRWALVAVMVVLAALIKPWFVLLAVAFFAARQWRWGGVALVSVAVTNVAAYLLWPRDFPNTIMQTVHNLSYTTDAFQDHVSLRNVSFGRGILLIPDVLEFFTTGGKMPDGFLAGPRALIGYVILVVVLIAVVALGRRIPPVMTGIALLATSTLFLPVAYYYHLVFVLPIAALIVRDPKGPSGSGIFDGLEREGGGRRRAVGIFVSLATALSIAQVALPGMIVEEPVFGQFGARGMIDKIPVAYVTTEIFIPFLWLVAVAAIIVSYARRPGLTPDTLPADANEDELGEPGANQLDESGLLTESSSPGEA